ncbi:tetratricopeptide repeat-containing sensor histidine kinase [Maribacter sp. CXY002]|uniref:tetratricopeptide repeat-containing sensor histidine kinase n=1 Tax=Maribacter luteocoastalis TaxID=3407671 RepID=UPI003B67F5C6
MQTVVSSLLKASNDKTKSLNTRLVLLDSAINLTKYNSTDSLFLEILLAKSNLHYNLNQRDSAIYYDNLLKVKAKYISNDYYLANAHKNIGYYFDDLSMPDSAYYHFNQSRRYFVRLKDSLAVVKNSLLISIIKKDYADYFGSKETLTDALTYLSETKEAKIKASIFNELATNHRKLLNYEDAILYYLKAIETSEEEKTKSFFKNNLAATYVDNGKYNKAIDLLQEIKSDTVLKKDSSRYARILDNLAYAQWHKNEKISYNSFLKPLQIRKEKNDKRGQIASYTHLGEYFLKTNSKKAERYLDTVIQISKQLKIPKAEQDALKFLMDLQPKNTDIRNRYIFLQDSLYEVGLKVKTQFAKMKYDDEQKQLSILKLEAEKERKNAELAEQRTQKIIWLAVSGLLVIGGITTFYSLRQRYKKEKLQEVYATEKRISKKVHDELANDIYGVMTRIEHAENLLKEETLDVLEDIYKRTRDISHETGSIDTQNFQDELKRLLSQFRNNQITIASKGLSKIKWNSITDEKKIMLYRVLNELLVNMKKHSGANLASISFKQAKKHLLIEYVDNGRGVQLPIKKGAGLSNTENRINNSNGTFSFDSKPGKGVKISCTFRI